MKEKWLLKRLDAGLGQGVHSCISTSMCWYLILHGLQQEELCVLSV